MAKTLSEAGIQGAVICSSGLGKLISHLEDAKPDTIKKYLDDAQAIEGSKVVSTTFMPALISVLKKVGDYLSETKETATVLKGTVKELYEKNANAHALEKNAEATMENFEAEVGKKHAVPTM